MVRRHPHTISFLERNKERGAIELGLLGVTDSAHFRQFASHPWLLLLVLFEPLHDAGSWNSSRLAPGNGFLRASSR